MPQKAQKVFLASLGAPVSAPPRPSVPLCGKQEKHRKRRSATEDTESFLPALASPSLRLRALLRLSAASRENTENTEVPQKTQKVFLGGLGVNAFSNES